MQRFFADYLILLEDCHTEILNALDGLPSEALDWTPAGDMNSMSVLITHITGSMRYWIGTVAAQDPTERDRDAEFRVHDINMNTLKARLAETVDYARLKLQHLTLQDLEALRASPNHEREHTVGWSLMHALEHATLHVGQIQTLRHLWERSVRSTE